MSDPQIKQDELYQLLRHGDIASFNHQVKEGASCDLNGADLRGIDLRDMNAKGLDMRNAYLRQADLRGIDFSETNLEGASLNGAKISGTLFPKELRAEEILLSLQHGTRMRYMRLKINLSKKSAADE
jgi:uncharacterized protein YjbI with pentapeptide repeats